jgi:hypothetical protein
MDAQYPRSTPEETEPEVSLVRGGAFYGAQRAVRLTAEDRFNLVSQHFEATIGRQT